MKNMSKLNVNCNYFQDNENYQEWSQPDGDEKIVASLQKTCQDIHNLTQRKMEISHTELLPGGILAKWLCKKYHIDENQLMEAKHQLYAECERQRSKVHQQQSVLDEEIRVLRLRLKTLSEKLTPSEKDNSVYEFFQGERMQDIEPKFMCFENNCGKVFKKRANLNRHAKQRHPWQLMPAVQPTVNASTCNSASVCAVFSQTHVPTVVVPTVVVPSVVVPSVVEPSVVEPPKVPPSKVSSFKSVTPRLGLYKRPGPQLCVGQAKLPKQIPEPNNGFPSDVPSEQIWLTGKNMARIAQMGKTQFYYGRPAAKNVVTHEASHILNRGADYYCANDLTPMQLAEYKRHCNFFVFEFPPNENTNGSIVSSNSFVCYFR
ncbi:hypothetical protein GHT06_015255 [Daphnia sinensis]|uniref:C2H2-type domain-containing protein n=1 Tax=Daphnia sinensis TaxID=1820382 RepID=A0AAD5LIS4_9CRUS|nr:hypothetical protein GHT06_015255 [Daphnia sinensis]